jgi:hypothetical protein
MYIGQSKCFGVIRVIIGNCIYKQNNYIFNLALPINTRTFKFTISPVLCRHVMHSLQEVDQFSDQDNNDKPTCLPMALFVCRVEGMS